MLELTKETLTNYIQTNVDLNNQNIKKYNNMGVPKQADLYNIFNVVLLDLADMFGLEINGQ